MRILSVNPYVSSNSGRSPSFEAIHPVKYHVKCADGYFREVTNPDTIKLLQRKLIGWLNKAMNDTKRFTEGKSAKINKSETDLEKKARGHLVNFFKVNDTDYAQNQTVRSVYLGGRKGERLVPYILSGKSVELCGDGKSIGKIHGKIRESREFYKAYYGATDEQARGFVSPTDARKLSKARNEYHEQSVECVKKLMADSRVDKSPIDFYFEPSFTPKSKKLSKFNLVNAIMKRYMIDPNV